LNRQRIALAVQGWWTGGVKKPILGVALLAFASVVQAGAVERKLLGRPRGR